MYLLSLSLLSLCVTFHLAADASDSEQKSEIKEWKDQTAKTMELYYRRFLYTRRTRNKKEKAEDTLNERREKKGRLGTKPDKDQLTEDVMDVMKKDVEFVSELNDDVFTESLDQFNDIDGNSQDLAAISRKMTKLKMVKDPEKLDKKTMKKMGNLVKTLPPDTFDKINGTELKEAMTDIKDAKICKRSAKKAMKNLMASNEFDLKTATGSDLKSLGQFAKGLSSEDVDKLVDDAVAQAIDSMAEVDLDPAQAKTLVRKAKRAGHKITKELGNLLKHVSPDNLTSSENWREDLGLDAGISEDVELELTESQSFEVMAKIVEEEGGDITKMDPEYIERLGALAATGLSVKQIRNIGKKPQKMLRLMKAFAKHVENMTLAQCEELANQAASELELKELSQHDLALTAPLLSCADQVKLTELKSNILSLIARVGSQLECERHSRQKMRSLVLMYLGNVPTRDSVPMNLTVEGTVEVSDMEEIGANVGGLEPAEAERMSDDAAKSALASSSQACFINPGVMTVLISKAKSNNQLDSAAGVVEACEALPQLTEEELSDLDPEVKKEAALDVLVCMAKRKRMNRMRTKHGLVDMKQTEVEEQEDKIDNVVKVFKESFQETDNEEMEETKEPGDGESSSESIEAAATDGGSDDDSADSESKQILAAVTDEAENSELTTKEIIATTADESETTAITEPAARRRIKRAPVALDCSTVAALGEAALALPPDEISTLTTYADCAESFGILEGWSSSQMKAIMQLAKDAWGRDLSQWPAENVIAAGSVLAVLPTVDLETLQLNTDVLAMIGKYDTFEDAQLETGFSRWLAVSELQISDVTSDDLGSIGAFACGLTTEHIKSVSPEVYRGAASSIGSFYKSCNQGKREAYVELAMHEDGFGPVAVWDTPEITQIGIILVGLCKFDGTDGLESLNYDQIRSIDSGIFPHIPVDCMKKLKVEHLRVLSTTQAAAVTDLQKLSLESHMRDAVDLAVGGSSLVGDARNELADMLENMINKHVRDSRCHVIKPSFASVAVLSTVLMIVYNMVP